MVSLAALEIKRLNFIRRSGPMFVLLSLGFFFVAGEEVKTVVVKIFPDLKRRQLIVDLRDFVLLLV